MAKQATKEDPFKQLGYHADDMRAALNAIAPSMSTSSATCSG